MTFEVQAFPGYSRAALFDLVVSSYFTSFELSEARQLIEQGASYAEALGTLAEKGQHELRRLPCCLTIPGGKILAFPPDRAASDLSYIPFPLMEVVQAAFPPLSDGCEEHSPGPLTLWREDVPSTPKHAASGQSSSTSPVSPGRVSFDLVQLSNGKERWAAKAKGRQLSLGYQVYPLHSGREGFWVDLLHLQSEIVVCSVIVYTTHIDHERIREWVIACLQVAAWTQGYQSVLRQQPRQKGVLKRQVLAHSLEAIWQKQEQQTRQQALFAVPD